MNYSYKFPQGATAQSRPGLSHYQGFIIILRHTTVGRTSLDQLSARGRDLHLQTHNTQNRQTNSMPGGIRTRNPSKREASEQRLRRRGHWGRRIYKWARKISIVN
jgi:hypothetical protein